MSAEREEKEWAGCVRLKVYYGILAPAPEYTVKKPSLWKQQGAINVKKKKKTRAGQAVHQI